MAKESTCAPEYERLLNAPDDAKSEVDSPPSYHEVNEQSEANCATLPQATNVPCNEKESVELPSYTAATTLPSYKDVEEQKKDEALFEAVNEFFHLRDETESGEPYLDGMPIGNDCLFLFAYLVAFFFNWIGLFLGYLVMFNWAGRYGAMAGFGTSMIKWLAYLRYSECCRDYYLNEHEYLFWILIFLAFVILIKGMVNWLQVRRLRQVSADTADSNARYYLFE